MRHEPYARLYVYAHICLRVQGMERQLSDEAEKERTQLEAQRKAKEAEIQAQIERCALTCHHGHGMCDKHAYKSLCLGAVEI
jgi:hypothetical protein